MHKATVTIRLPRDIESAEELAALRSAGIPIDADGYAVSGYLFIRLTRSRHHMFRWFAKELDRKSPDCALSDAAVVPALGCIRPPPHPSGSAAPLEAPVYG
jgi:hypothetical protein